MKTQQWQLRKAPEPRTLADVESSREKPVLFWSTNGILTHGFDDETLGPMRLDLDGEVIRLHGFAKEYSLYAQPSRPTRLEDMPDRRVIYASVVTPAGTDQGYKANFFRHLGTWYEMPFEPDEEYSDVDYPSSTDWKLTDCVVELVETEIVVVG